MLRLPQQLSAYGVTAGLGGAPVSRCRGRADPVHDARFLIDSGECVFGPCPGESLEALPIRVQDDSIYLIREA